MTKRPSNSPCPERARLESLPGRTGPWRRWGPYLAERQWGTGREDYSPDGSFWTGFDYKQSRHRVYRWGEDGLLGWSDHRGRLGLSVALWNECDDHLKERLFGVTGPQGNHGEDVKELYYYLAALPSYAYAKARYVYPQSAFPYKNILDENQARNRSHREYELVDTNIFSEDKFFLVDVEYAKASAEDTLITYRIRNASSTPAALHVIPQLVFRNTWSWGTQDEDATQEPHIERVDANTLHLEHPTLGQYRLYFQNLPVAPTPLFTDNETNTELLYGLGSTRRWYKDAFHRRIVDGNLDAINPADVGTKAGLWHRLELKGHGEFELRLRLQKISPEAKPRGAKVHLGPEFAQIRELRREEYESYYDRILPSSLDADAKLICKQAYAGLLWSKQFYFYCVRTWLDGDPKTAPPAPQRKRGRNADWKHLYNRAVISMPDKWEYPWYAAWDLAFHMIPMARVDPEFAKRQLLLLLEESYLHPNGQLPAYELQLGDVNPPVHAWACWRIYLDTADDSEGRDIAFLRRAFHKLVANFTWWINRKDPTGRHMFSGGFLGLDNIGVFDRNQTLPGGSHLEQADATAWMAFYSLNMLTIALELARNDDVYIDLACKFFEHFVRISDAINTIGDSGLWDENDGFYYDQVWNESMRDGQLIRVRSLVGLIPLIAVEVFDFARIEPLDEFWRRSLRLISNRPKLGTHLLELNPGLRDSEIQERYVMALMSRRRLRRVLHYLLSEDEFLSPFGIRSLSKYYEAHPYTFILDGHRHEVRYAPGESQTEMFGGNSNWRGPIWFPINYLIVSALRSWHRYHGPEFRVECPSGSGTFMHLGEVADELQRRLCSLLRADPHGHRPALEAHNTLTLTPDTSPSLLFHEYFHGDSGRGLGASHQTGWTALIATCFEELAQKSQPAIDVPPENAPLRNFDPLGLLRSRS